jgi:hypothetical protein
MTISRVCLVVVIIVFAYGCEKEKTGGNFAVGGSFYAGNTTLFKTVSASEREITWDFGDSTTAIGAIASHVFSSLGTYTVIMTVGKEEKVSKVLKIGGDSSKLARISGERRFDYSDCIHNSCYNSPPHCLYVDTLLKIYILDPITICIGSDTLRNYKISSDVLSFYSLAKRNTMESCFFYPSSDSIVSSLTQAISACGFRQYSYHSK